MLFHTCRWTDVLFVMLLIELILILLYAWCWSVLILHKKVVVGITTDSGYKLKCWSYFTYLVISVWHDHNSMIVFLYFFTPPASSMMRLCRVQSIFTDNGRCVNSLDFGLDRYRFSHTVWALEHDTIWVFNWHFLKGWRLKIKRRKEHGWML